MESDTKKSRKKNKEEVYKRGLNGYIESVGRKESRSREEMWKILDREIGNRGV